MKIDIFRVKKMSTESEGNDTEEYITTVDMQVIPRVGETIYYYDTADKGRELFGLGAVRKSTFLVEKVAYFAADGRHTSIEVVSHHNPVALFVS